jgi:hypothetical protein
MSNKTITTQGQSAIDIAIQEYGAWEGIFLLLDDNPGLGSVEAVPAPGIELVIREVPVVNNGNVRISEQFKKESYRVNSGNNESTTGYYEEDYIESDYIE